MILFYRLLFLPCLVFVLPYYLLRMFKRGGYTKGFKNRIGIYNQVPLKRKKRIWIHAVSVGELFSISKLLEELTLQKDFQIFLTTTTSTGFAAAKEKYSSLVDYISVFPIDFVPFSKNAWETFNPDCIIMMDSEVWPEHLYQAKKRKVPALLINARLSDRSFNRYKKFKWIQNMFLKRFTVILASTQQDYQRILELKIPPNQVEFCGNLKFDVTAPAENLEAIRKEIRKELFQLEAEDPIPWILLGSSTWPGEERMLIKAFMNIRKNGIHARLILVPRHAERKNEIVRELKLSQMNWHQRSICKSPDNQKIDIYLADTTGELKHISQVADLAFIGKSMHPNQGGQTPIEAASLSIPILFGPNMSNFKDISQSLLQAGAAIEVQNNHDAERKLIEILQNPLKMKSMGDAGRQWHNNNLGATQKAVETIHQLIS